MEAATERRAPHESRVPLDDVLVEIAPEGMAESFEADGVNVGPGGLSMRSPILPDVGARLRCRFNSPHDGSSVDADCEVVWAEDSGPNLGEFGLRFTGLAPTDAEAIRRLVDSWHTELDGAQEPVEATAVTLHLDGVGQAVEAELVHRATDALLVEQPLPFLEIGTGIEESGRHGRLEAVDLRMDGETPRLVLTIGYASASSDAPAMTPAIDPESTLMDAVAPSFDVSEQSFESDSSDDFEENSSFDQPFDARALEETGDAPFEAGSIDDSIESLASAPLDADDAEAIAAFRSAHGLKLHKARVAVKTQAGKLRLWLVAVWSKAAPTARAWWAKARHFGGDIGRRIGPWMRTLRKRMKKKEGEPRRTARRATRAPKRRTTRAPSKPDKAPGRRRFRLRWVLLAVAVGVGVALVTRAEPEYQANKLPKPTEPELGDVVELAPPPPPPPVIEQPLPEAEQAQVPAEPVGPAEPVEPTMPRALPEPTRSAGQISAPSFPSLGESRPADPGTVPADSPYAVDVRESAARSFGLDEVPGGRQFRIRMSQPVQGMHGEATDDGFRVVLVGANATEGARRIASVHPDVERARIENEGEQATLSLRFVGERRPPYRVHASGAALFVTLGR